MERRPILADNFYPADERTREARVAALFDPAAQSKRALGVVIPHGAIEVTGPTAAKALAQVEVPELVVLLTGAHAAAAPRGAIQTLGALRLPGARVPVDTRFAEDLAGVALLTEDAHPHEREHAFEAVLPLLLHRNPRLRVVPVVFSPMPHATAVRVGKALADSVQNHGRDVLVVATTGLCAYLPSRVVDETDAKTIAAVESLDGAVLSELASAQPAALDGPSAVSVLLACARALGRDRARLVEHTVRTPNLDRVGECYGQASFVID